MQVPVRTYSRQLLPRSSPHGLHVKKAPWCKTRLLMVAKSVIGDRISLQEQSKCASHPLIMLRREKLLINVPLAQRLDPRRDESAESIDVLETHLFVYGE